MFVSGIRAALAALVVAATSPALAQYPSKQITIVVPLAAGSGVDLVTRFYIPELAKNLGKPVVVDNRPGAATMIGTSYVASAPADGHTLLAATSSAMAINPFLYKKMNYVPLRDFVPINHYLKSPFVLCVHPGIAANTVPELIKLAKARVQPFTFGSPGAGTTQHLSVEYLKHRFGVDITHVPYRSNPQYINDLVAGHLSLAFVESASASQLIAQGKLRGIASATAERLAVLPNIPTLAEAVNDPSIETVSWHMLFAPAATPKDVVERLHAETRKLTTTPVFQKFLLDRGQVPVASPPPEAIGAYIRSEQEKWGGLVRRLGLEGSQ
jgi:tripartite-type tricarboxylate transporter receptor subunit TctC